MTTKYTERLLRKGEERQRLTRQLADLVGAVAEEIAGSVPVGTEVDVPGVGILAVIERESNISAECFLALRVYDEAGVPRWVVFERGEPSSTYYLHRDFRCPITRASREQYLAFANHLLEIVTAFEAAEDKAIDALRAAFERLRRIAEATTTVDNACGD